MAEWKRKYHWRATWPGEGHNDWSAYDGDRYIGRILEEKHHYARKGTYIWAGGAHGADVRNHVMPNNGNCAEAWQAAKAVEDWYDALLKANGHLSK